MFSIKSESEMPPASFVLNGSSSSEVPVMGLLSSGVLSCFGGLSNSTPAILNLTIALIRSPVCARIVPICLLKEIPTIVATTCQVLLSVQVEQVLMFPFIFLYQIL
ncbi:MAG: hypothetical protein ACN4E2_05910 [Nitrospinota bacterium]